MPSSFTIHTIKKEMICSKASEFLINWLRLYHNIGKKTLLLLSGGSAVKIYYELAEFIKNSGLNFDFLSIGQVDERFQPGMELGIKNYELGINKEDINAYQIGKTGLWKVCEKKNIPYYLVSQENTLDKSVAKYNQQLKDVFEHFSYRIGLLGIGEDAHTAGLMPGYQKSWDKKSYAVGYNNKSRFHQRISVTPRCLASLDHAIVVALGEGKKEAIKRALNPANVNKIDKYPAALLQKIKKVDLFTDQKV